MPSIKKIVVIIVIVLVATAVIFLFLTNNNSNQSDLKKTDSTGSLPSFVTDETSSDFYSFTQKIPEKNLGESIISGEILNKTGTTTPIDTLLHSLGTDLPQEISSMITKHDYTIFSCSTETTVLDHGIMLNVSPIMSEDEIYSVLRSWEKQLLHDMHFILFPEYVFSSEQLEQSSSFQDGKYRYLTFTTSDGTQKSINYRVINESIFISSSLACLENGMENLFSL